MDDDVYRGVLVSMPVRGDVHGGRSTCRVGRLPDGRLRLQEHFHWESREGSGTNVLEQVEE